jgi:predicted phosphodiesterase
MPDEVYVGEKERRMKIESNTIQKKIFTRWECMVDDVGKVDAVINLGDTVDGTNRHSQGTGLWTTDINLQMEVAANLLSMVKTNKYLGVQGSYYHVGDNVSSDRAVIHTLGGTFGDELAIVSEGKRIHASHDVGVSSSGLAYRTTPIAQQLMVASLSKEYGKFNVILRGHAHYFVHVAFTEQQGVICPCWKGRDEYVARKSLAFLPHLGYVILNIKDRITVEPHIFTLKGKDVMKEVVV